MSLAALDQYIEEGGIRRPRFAITHREEEYQSSGFDRLRQMQQRHFWYRGRHRFLWHAVRSTLRRLHKPLDGARIIDLGGGCGGWISYLTQRNVQARELALGDSSLRALTYAADVLPDHVQRYQIDLLRLDWQERWDVAFLLDVLEHLPDDRAALSEIHRALTPGGLLFVTTPALRQFWTYNDELARHVRRYAKADFRRLAADTGFELLDARYFQFFLSPLLLVCRWLRQPQVSRMTEAERQALMTRTHRTPGALVNSLLILVFTAETPLGHWLPFPWGTSVLAVLRRSASGASG